MHTKDCLVLFAIARYLICCPSKSLYSSQKQHCKLLTNIQYLLPEATISIVVLHLQLNVIRSYQDDNMVPVCLGPLHIIGTQARRCSSCLSTVQKQSTYDIEYEETSGKKSKKLVVPTNFPIRVQNPLQIQAPSSQKPPEVFCFQWQDTSATLSSKYFFLASLV